MTVDEIEWVGGDEMGPAVWRFICNKSERIHKGEVYRSQYQYIVPYAALVEKRS